MWEKKGTTDQHNSIGCILALEVDRCFHGCSIISKLLNIYSTDILFYILNIES